jgi:hypothetical protein
MKNRCYSYYENNGEDIYKTRRSNYNNNKYKMIINYEPFRIYWNDKKHILLISHAFERGVLLIRRSSVKTSPKPRYKQNPSILSFSQPTTVGTQLKETAPQIARFQNETAKDKSIPFQMYATQHLPFPIPQTECVYVHIPPCSTSHNREHPLSARACPPREKLFNHRFRGRARALRWTTRSRIAKPRHTARRKYVNPRNQKKYKHRSTSSPTLKMCRPIPIPPHPASTPAPALSPAHWPTPPSNSACSPPLRVPGVRFARCAEEGWVNEAGGLAR